MERIGIYGGSFNPPHIGHIRAAQCAVRALGLSKMLLIPCNISPGKAIPEGSANADQRLQMLNMAAQGDPMLQICRMELDRGGVSYTCDTVAALREEYPQAELVVCMGADAFCGFDSWKDPGKILGNASVAVFYRGGKNEEADISAMEQKLSAMGGRVYRVDNPVTDISSTQLRRMLEFHCADPFLHLDVADYIRKEGIYATACDYRQLPMDKLEKVVISLLKPNRVAHVIGCRDTAVQMARHWGADENDAARAAILHDITKALDGPLQLTLCREYGIVLDDFSSHNPKTLHALTGALVAQRIFGEKDTVVNAIRWHTTGKADMNVLQKIIYVADYMEPNRDFPGVEQLRHLAFTDLDGALKMGLEMTISMLKEQGREISPESQQAICWLNSK